MPRRSDAVGGVRRFVDISVPRNVAPDIDAAAHGGIVYNVDDLKEVVVANKEARAAAAAEAEVLLRCVRQSRPRHAQRRRAAGGRLQLVAAVCSARAFGAALAAEQQLPQQHAAGRGGAHAAADARVRRPRWPRSCREEQRSFEAWRDSLETVPTIKALRAKAESIRAAEFEKALSRLGEGMSKKQMKAVEELSKGIVNKLLHGPMTALRCDGTDPDAVGQTLANMEALERMFELAQQGGAARAPAARQ